MFCSTITGSRLQQGEGGGCFPRRRRGKSPADRRAVTPPRAHHRRFDERVDAAQRAARCGAGGGGRGHFWKHFWRHFWRCHDADVRARLQRQIRAAAGKDIDQGRRARRQALAPDVILRPRAVPTAPRGTWRVRQGGEPRTVAGQSGRGVGRGCGRSARVRSPQDVDLLSGRLRKRGAVSGGAARTRRRRFEPRV